MRRYACEMALLKCLFTLVLLTAVTGQSESASEFSGSPVITSTNLTEVVVYPGEDYVITCESDALILWTYPNISGRDPNISVTNKNGKYLSSLQLSNVSYKDVGYYKCLSENDKLKNSSLYLYVKDEVNLFTHAGIHFTPISGIQFQDIIIPCKPTHPGVKVTLRYNCIDELQIGENGDFGVVRYNHKIGFILENAQITNNGYYYCCVLPGDTCSPEECPRQNSLHVLKRQDSVARPAIDETHLQHVKVGDDVTIECRVTVSASTRYTLEWITPNTSDRIIEELTEIETPVNPAHHLTTGRKKLRIIHAELDDAGNYTCKVKDLAGNTNSETIYLKIYSI